MRTYIFLCVAWWLVLPAAVIAGAFQPLFNGNSSEGWCGALDNYSFANGMIQCRADRGGVVYTKKQYADFIVRFEFRLPPGGNNGLAIRYPGSGDPAYTGMCELQVLDNTAGKYRALDPRQYHGSAYGMAAARRGCLKPVGEWNAQTVTVIGSTIKVELNGTCILDTDLAQVTEYLHDKPHPGKTRSTGHFGFAGHNSPVAFRNIFIREL